MNYNEARELLKDGDVVFFPSVTWKQKFVTFFTGGTVSHCGFVVWLTDGAGTRRCMLLEAHSGGCRVVNLSCYKYRGIIAFRTNLDWPTVAEYAVAKTGNVPYSYIDCLMIGIKNVYRRVVGDELQEVPNFAGEVCSEMCADVFIKSGVYKLDLTLSPDELLYFCNTVGKRIVEVPSEI